MCSIESATAFDEMSNVVRAIVITADNANTQTSANAARLLYVLNNDKDIPANIKSLIGKAQKVTIVVDQNAPKSHYEVQWQYATEQVQNQYITHVSHSQVRNSDSQFAESLFCVSAQRDRAGPKC